MAHRKSDEYEINSKDIIQIFKKDLGLESIEGKQKLEGDVENWEIDAKGILEEGGGTIVIECKRWKNRIPKPMVANLAYSIKDVNAQGGILVSPLDMQSGAKNIAEAENINHIKITPESDVNNFDIEIFGKSKGGRSLGASINAVEDEK